jgi:hypothetical protein
LVAWKVEEGIKLLDPSFNRYFAVGLLSIVNTLYLLVYIFKVELIVTSVPVPVLDLSLNVVWILTIFELLWIRY